MREDIKERIEKIKRGKVPEGYRKTKVGIIPIEWTVCTFSKVANVQSGLVDPKIEPYSKMYHIGPENIEKDTGRIVNVQTAEEQKLISGKYEFDENSVIYSKVRPNLNKVCIPNYRGICSADCYAIHIKNNIDKIYLYNYMLSQYYLKQAIECSMRTKMPKINQDELSIFRIILPGLSEQKQIGNIISQYDKYIAIQEELIAEKGRLKKYLFQNLLTCKLRLEGFTKEWYKIRLKKVLCERKEYAQKGQEYEHVTLSKGGIYAKGERYDRDHLVKDEEKEYKVTRLNDICYNPANLKFGVICRNIYGNAIFSPIYVTFEVNDNFDVEFISQYVMRWDFINAVRKYEEGTVYERMAVNSKDFLDFEILIPEKEEQKAIAKILSQADKEIELLQQRLEQIKLEKKAMMQLLLTGTVRVNQHGGE